MISNELIGWPFAHLCVMLRKANVLELHTAVLRFVIVTTATSKKMCIRSRAIVGTSAE